MSAAVASVPQHTLGAADEVAADLVVATTGLTKQFRGGQLAVNNVDLAVPRGAVYGFLGPNGSGKTTTIRMLLGLAMPTSGQIDLLGAAVPAHATTVLHRVGSLVEGPAFHPYLSGRANLARLDVADVRAESRTSRKRIDEALDRVGLLAAAGKRYRNYSLGMRQRLAIASALLAPRDLLVLDEPTNGLDPQGTREVRSLVAGLTDGGTTVLVSSHLLSEVEQMCTHVGVMRTGELLAQGPIQQFRAGGAVRVLVTTPNPAGAADVLVQLGCQDVRIEGDHVHALPQELLSEEPEHIVARLVGAGIAVRGFQLRAPSLEDLFVQLTGEGFDVSG